MRILRIILCVVAVVFCLFMIGCSNSGNTEKDNNPTNTVSNVLESPDSEKKNDEYDKVKLDNFFKAYVERGDLEKIKELSSEFGVFFDQKKTGTSIYHKVALSKEEAKAVSLSDLYTGHYCIVVEPGGKSIIYYDNVDMIEIKYVDGEGFYIYDKTKLTPFDEGTPFWHIDSIDEALAYRPAIETDVSPIEEFYSEAEIGMSESDFRALLSLYNLQMRYRRSNSDDGYISPAGEMSTNGYTTYITFVLSGGVVTDLDFRDYYVKERFGLYIDYISNKQTGKNYDKAGYYIVGGEKTKFYDNGADAIKCLHAYRLAEK